MERRRLAIFIVLLATALILGRTLAVNYSDFLWFSALDSQSVWRLSFKAKSFLYISLFTAGFIFSMLNLLAVRRSIIFLFLPKRVGNMRIDERVDPSQLMYIAVFISIFAAGISLTSVTGDWTILLPVITGVEFGEIDPYLGYDISHYTAWIPFEKLLFKWSTFSFGLVSILVISLYALTPSLSIRGRSLRASAYTKRHFAVLAAVLVALIAWKVRLTSFDIIVAGSGKDGLITPFDHRVFLPSLKAAYFGIFGAAVAVILTGWMKNQLATLLVLTAVGISAVILLLIFPVYSSRTAQSGRQKLTGALAPYLSTRSLYAQRALPEEGPFNAVRWVVDSTQNLAFIGRSPSDKTVEETSLHPNGELLIYPGATGYSVTLDTTVRGISLQTVIRRILLAWSEQSLIPVPEQEYRAGIAGNRLRAVNARLVSNRDLRHRLKLLTPLFAQSVAIGKVPNHYVSQPSPDEVIWVVDLYSTSERYPLSPQEKSGEVLLNYRRHAGTAYINAHTGAVFIDRPENPDPIAKAWYAYVDSHQPDSSPWLSRRTEAGLAADWNGKLNPLQSSDSSGPAADSKEAGVSKIIQNSLLGDSVSRQRVRELYLSMKSALARGDFTGFGAALDSLRSEAGLSD